MAEWGPGCSPGCFQVPSDAALTIRSLRVLELTLPAREIIRSTPRTRIIRIDLDGHAFPFVAGQAVFAGLASGTVRRPYSIACSPGQSEREAMIELLVQIDDHDAPDPHLELVERGTPLRVQGPFGNFSLPSDDTMPLLFIAGGTGIAPLRSMLWDTLERDSHPPLGVLYSARSPEEFAYAGELLTLAGDGRLDLLRTITRDTTTDWDGTRGRLNSELIGRMLKTPETRCVICGPAALVADASAIAKAFGVSAEHILTETYST